MLAPMRPRPIIPSCIAILPWTPGEACPLTELWPAASAGRIERRAHGYAPARRPAAFLTAIAPTRLQPRGSDDQRTDAAPAVPAGPCAGAGRSVAAEQRHQAALHLHLVTWEDPRLVPLVGGFEGDRVAAPAQPLQCHLVVIDQRHHDLAVLGRLALADHHRVAVQDAGVHHRIAGDLEREMLAG